MTDKPHFRFFPRAYETQGVFEESTKECECCEKPSVWLHSGIIYCQGNRPDVCARCISSGALDNFFEGRHYSFHDMHYVNAAQHSDDSFKVDPELSFEALCRTPHITSYNPFQWPVINSKPMAFFGYGDNKHVLENPDAIESMKKTWLECVGEELGPNLANSYLLVFKGLDEPIFASVVDFD